MRAHRMLSGRGRVALAMLALSLAGVAQAHAGGVELIQSLGEPLLAYANASRDEGLRTLVVNGARLQLRTGSTPDSLDAVLDAQVRPCRVDGAWLNPVVRTRSSDQGVAGCILAPDGHDLGDRLHAFATSHDVSSLGQLRVTWAMRSGDATRYVAIGSDGPLELLAMFPADGDAPGVDVAGLPRPPEARRVLSTWQDGTAPLLVSYESSLSLDELERAYTADLSAHGEVKVMPQPVPDERALLFVGDERNHLAILARDGEGTLISIIPFANDATVPEVAR
jgi:hypothetical protein